jgi:hypothetical protein
MRLRWSLLTLLVIGAAVAWLALHEDAAEPLPAGRGPSAEPRAEPPTLLGPTTAPAAPEQRAAPEGARGLRVRVVGPDGVAVPRFEARLLLPSGYRKLEQDGAGELPVSSGAEPWIGALLEIWNARDAGERGLGHGAARVGPLTGGQSELEVRLRPGPMLEGVVLGPEGPLADPVTVELGPLER